MKMLMTGVAALTLLAGAAWAQPTALVVTTLTDPGTGLPMAVATGGQLVRMRTTVSWTAGGSSQMAGIAGDMMTTPAGFGGVGAISNIFSEYTPGMLVHLGTVSGDDLLGIDIAVTPSFFTGGFLVPPSYYSTGIDFIGFDWEAPNEPGIYDFEFRASAAAPNFRLYPSSTSPAFIEVPTTYVSARLLVIPSPMGAAVLVVAGGVGVGRRRRP